MKFQRKHRSKGEMTLSISTVDGLKKKEYSIPRQKLRDTGEELNIILLYILCSICVGSRETKWYANESKKVLIIITKRLACHQVVLQLKNSLVFVKCAHITKPSENARTHWIVRYVLDYGQMFMSVCAARACVYFCDESNSLY